MTLASAYVRLLLPTEFTTHKWETEAQTELFYARSLKFINVMQTQAFQPIKLLMLCESTLEWQVLIICPQTLESTCHRAHTPQLPSLLPQKKPVCLEPVGSGQSDYTHYPYMMFKGQLYYPFLTLCNVCFKFLEKG